MPYEKISVKLKDHDILINNGIDDPVIFNRMLPMGYSWEEMNHAKGLLEEAKDANRLNHSEQSEYHQAVDRRREAKDIFHEEYISDLELARIAFRNDQNILSKIDASGTRERGIAEYLGQAENFYKSLAEDPSLLEKMAVFGYTTEIINERLASIGNIWGHMRQIEREEGDSQHQVNIRDEKLDELDDWASIYKRVARVVFKDEPQYLEKLGIIVRS
jgi:hypothetical protein